MPKAYRSDALAAVHEVAHGLAEAGAMDKRRLRGFDALCLTQVEPLSPAEIRALRLRENASQAIFCAPFECDDWAGEPMGARRKTAERGFVEIADAGGAEGVAGGGLRGDQDDDGLTRSFMPTLHLSTRAQPNVRWRYRARGVNRFRPYKSRS